MTQGITATAVEQYRQQVMELARQKPSKLRKNFTRGPDEGEALRIAAKKAIWKDELGTIARYCRKNKINMAFDSDYEESYTKGLLVGRLLGNEGPKRYAEYKEIAEFYLSQNRSSVFRSADGIGEIRRSRAIAKMTDPPILITSTPQNSKSGFLDKFFKSFA